mgnify:CR=1 FL=1
MWASVIFGFVLIDSIAGLRYSVRILEGSPSFKLQLKVERADRFGWIVLYRRLPGMNGWGEIQKVYVDRWVLPKEYSLEDKVRGEIGWSYRVVWRSANTETEIGTYYPYGRLPVPPRIHQEKPESRVLQCTFFEPGKFLLRGYNSYGEEVFTLPIEISEACVERYQLPPLRKGRYLVRLLEPQSSVSLAEIVVAL